MDYEKTLKTVKQMVEDGQVSQETAELYFPELKESKDERIRKELIELIGCMNNADPRKERWIAWLEKQGKQKPFDYENANIQQMDFAPKFHEGDWVVNNDSGGICQITEIRNDEYCLWPFGSKVMGYVRIINTNNNYHLWTIQDAKDGDVLQLGEVTAIFKKFIGNENCICYCSVCEGEFEIPNQDGDDNNYGCFDATPATKEQRNALFAKMKNAGYEWDADKKELKKIKQKPQRIVSAEAKEAMYDKPAWSEVDENHVFSITQTIFGAIKHNVIGRKTGDMQINWLRSLKERIEGE